MFEVVYKHFEKNEDGSWNKEDVKELRRRIGKDHDDVPLEKLAQVIISQFARRDILVLDVSIFEYKKVEVSFRETKGGIVIKNKKFSLDSDAGLVMSDLPDVEVTATGALVPVSGGVMPHNNLPVPGQQAGGMRRPIKWVALDTDDMVVAKVKGAGLQFSANKRYPVFQEMSDPRDKRVDKFGKPSLERKMVFIMWDDHSREVQVSADFFVSADFNLIGGNFNKSNDGPKLMFEAERNDDMVDIRARR